MAPFNRYIPATNDPTYIGYSKEIEGPKPNLALGKLFSGIGETLDAGLKGATDLLDINIGNEARTNLAAADVGSDVGLSSSDAAALGKMKNKAEKGILPTGEKTEAPAVVQEGISKLDKLTQQYNQGVLSPTYYLTQQQVIAQQLKQRYPGSEKEVDQAIHRETSSANQIRAQVFSDFQAAATAANSNQKDFIHFVRSKGDVLGDVGVTAALQPGVLNDYNKQIAIYAYIAKQEKSIKDTSTRKAQLDLSLTEGQVDSKDAERNLTLDLYGMSARAASGVLSPLTGLKEKLVDWATNGASPDEMNAARGQVAEMRRVLDDTFTAHINNPNLKGGQSYNSIIPDKGKIAAIRKSATESLDFIDDALNNKDPKVGASLVGWHIRDMEARIGMDADRLIQSSNVARALASTEKALGGQGNLTSQILNGNRNLGTRKDANGNPISAMSEIWQDVLKNTTSKIITGNGSISTVTNPQGGQKPPSSVLNQTIKNTVTVITDPSSPVGMQSNALKFLTSDTEGKFFKELDRPSQLQAFGLLTQPSVSKSAHELGDPQVWQDYKSWSQRTFNALSSSRRGDIQTLIGNPKLGLHFDPEVNQLVYTVPTPSVSRGRGDIPSINSEVNYPELQAITQINTGLRNIDVVYKQDKTKASDQLIPLFQSMGITIKGAEGSVKPQKAVDENSVDTLDKITKAYKINPQAWEDWLASGPFSTNIEDRRNDSQLPQEIRDTLKDLFPNSKQPQFMSNKKPGDKPMMEVPVSGGSGSLTVRSEAELKQALSGRSGNVTHPSSTWQIYDRHTGETVGQPYGNRIRASRRIDRLDNEYGGYRYGLKRIVEEEK